MPSYNLHFYPPQGTVWHERGVGGVHIRAPLQVEDCPHMLPLAIAILPPKLLTSPSHSFLYQGLCTRHPSACGQPLAYPGPCQDWPAKVSCAGKRLPGGPASSCLPRPGPPRVRSKPPRPWPGAHTSSPAQMPLGSRRVGTCPRAGIGTRAARPPHLCLPGSLLFCAQFPRVGSGSCPSLGRSRKPEGRGFPQRLHRGSRRRWVRCPLCPDWAGVLPNVRWEARPA